MRNVKAKAMKVDLRKPLLFMIALAVATVFTLTALAEKKMNVENPQKTVKKALPIQLSKKNVKSSPSEIDEKVAVMLDKFFLKMDQKFAKLNSKLDVANLSVNSSLK